MIQRIIKLLFPDTFDVKLGDFVEMYENRLREKGRIRTILWFLMYILKSSPVLLKTKIYRSVYMFKNYLKIALRNYKRNKSYTVINVLGLSTGIAACLLILLYVRFELSYDKYHDLSDRTYRVAMERTYPDKIRYWGWTAPLMAKTLETDFPEVETGTRIFANNININVTYEGKNILEKNVIYGDPEFFKVFSIPLIHGNPETVLSKPNSIVLTQEAAEKYFGKDEAVGKTLVLSSFNNDRTTAYTVTGISENVPENTHFSIS